MSKFKICINLTGSIACYKAADLISKLIQMNCEVQTVCTESALKFIGKATLEGLTDKAVLTDVFENKRSKAHIEVIKETDLFLIYPATANTINRISQGLAENMLECLFLANNFIKPYWIAPAMNVNMFNHPATQDSLEKLQNWGTNILPTQEGRLACGDIGLGKLLEPEIVIEMIKKEFL